MFGSISNWINTNIPQNIPTVSMPSMPAMPTMPNMPAMPAMPTMPAMPQLPLFGKKGEEVLKEGEEALPSTENEIVEQEQTSAPETKLNTDLNHIEPVVENQPEKEANPEAVIDPEAEDAEKGNDQKFGFHPNKAMGAAKDLGNNIGSKLLQIKPK